MMSARLFLALALVAAPLGMVLAQSGERGSGHIAARAYAATPAPLAFAIEPGDNSDENMALADRIAKEAARRGITVQPKSTALVLRFDTEVRGADTPPQRPSFSRPSGGVSDPDARTPSPPEARDEVTNLLTSRGGGVLNTRPRGSGSERLLRYVINASLEDGATGRRLWQGHVSYDSNTPDRTAMFVSLAPVLVEQIGKPVQERAFQLD